MRALQGLLTVQGICLKWPQRSSILYENLRTFCAKTSASARDEAQKTPTETAPKSESKAQFVQRSLHIAVIGVPNAGKSTFVNNLINHRVCPTSSKVHTTRKANKAICTTDDTQFVFYDTPGLVTEREIMKHKLEKGFKSGYRHAVQHADIVAVVHDVSNSWTRHELHQTVWETLHAHITVPSFLILNKIDTLKSKRILLELTRILTNNTVNFKRQRSRKNRLSNEFVKAPPVERSILTDLYMRETCWGNFEDVFLVSAATGDGLSGVHDFLMKRAKVRRWDYPSETFTDESPEGLIVDSVRARLLDYLPQEIPYSLQSVIEYYAVENNTIYASVQVICPSARLERLICGESNGKLKQITERVTSDLVETFGKPISLTISTISKKDKSAAKETDNEMQKLSNIETNS